MPEVNVAGFPCFEVQFDKDGALVGDDIDAPLNFVKAHNFTDLFVISHGWRNDEDFARQLYTNFFTCVRNILVRDDPALWGKLDANAKPALKARRFGVLAIYWPALKLVEHAEGVDAAAAASAVSVSLVSEADLTQQINDLKGALDAPDADKLLEDARKLISDLENPQSLEQFADLVRLTQSPPPPDQKPDPAEPSARFLKKNAATLVDMMKDPVVLTAPLSTPSGGAAAGIIDDLRDGIDRAVESARTAVVDAGQGVRDTAARIVNYTTYYQMKRRAGIVGMGDVYQVLRRIRDAAKDVRLHLIGHSFGARLVSSAALGPDGQPPLVPASMTLLQAAFSHYGFSNDFGGENEGFFRSVIGKQEVSGPILISHTAHDWAVGILYALASRFMGQAGQGIGDESDFFGGLGRNGAQKTPESVFLELGALDATYAFTPGKIFNLHADAIENHGDIAKDVIAYALLAAVATTK